MECPCRVRLKGINKVKVVGFDKGQEGVQRPSVQPQILRQQLKPGTARGCFHVEGIEQVIPLIDGIVEPHLHTSVAVFIVQIVVTPSLKPDLIDQAVFRFLFEVAIFQPLPALFTQAKPNPTGR